MLHERWEIIGTGKGGMDAESPEFEELRAKITAAYEAQSPLQKIENRLLSIRFRMESYLKEKEPAEIVPAGAFLKECVRATGIKNKDFAAYVGCEESNLSALFAGRRTINPDLAIKLGKTFNLPSWLWLDIQAKNDLLLLKREQPARYEKYRLEDLLALA